MRWRLSLLMFLLYAPAGAVVPFFTLRMQSLGFSPMEMGWACATQALAALVGPLTAGQIADRWCPAERCLTVLGFLAGAALWALADLIEPLAFFLTSLAFWLMMGPAITLGASLSFAHLAQPERDYGLVRLWGTVGWAMSGWLLGYWFLDPVWLCGLVSRLRPERPTHDLADIFRLAALLAWTLSAYACTLPHTPPRRQARTWLAPLAALRLARSRSFALYLACTLGMCVTLPFPAQVTPLLLKHLGLSMEWMGPTLTLGQSMEVISLAVLPALLSRLGVRGTMLFGMTAWLIALSILTVGEPLGLVIGSMTLNGLCVCCYFVAGQVFVNSRAHGDIRASAQALLSFSTGAGMLVGNLLVGAARGWAHGAFSPTFAVGAVIAAALTMVFFVGFHPEEEIETRTETVGPLLAARSND